MRKECRDLAREVESDRFLEQNFKCGGAILSIFNRHQLLAVLPLLIVAMNQYGNGRVIRGFGF